MTMAVGGEFTLADVYKAVALLNNCNIPATDDGYYRLYIPPPPAFEQCYYRTAIKGRIRRKRGRVASRRRHERAFHFEVFGEFLSEEAREFGE